MSEIVQPTLRETIIVDTRDEKAARAAIERIKQRRVESRRSTKVTGFPMMLPVAEDSMQPEIDVRDCRSSVEMHEKIAMEMKGEGSPTGLVSLALSPESLRQVTAAADKRKRKALKL